MTHIARTGDEPPEIMAHADLVASGDRGAGAGRRLVKIAIRRPVLYPGNPADVGNTHWSNDDSTTRLVGLVCAVELEKLPRGQEYGRLDVTVTLPSGCQVVAFPDQMATTTGLYAHEFTQSFDRPQDDRSLVAQAIVQVPHDMRELVGEQCCRVEIRRSFARYVKRLTAEMEKTVPFAEQVPDGGRAVRLVVSADMKAYSGRGPGGSQRAQERLATVSERACAATGVVMDGRQYGGDSFMFVFPPGVDESVILRTFYMELAAGLREVNLDLNAEAAIRLRVGADRGLTVRGGTGWTGDAPVTAARMSDCPAAREALAKNDADLVLVVSDSLYRDVFSDRGRVPSSESFSSCEVHIPQKNFTANAWIHVPGDANS